MFISVKKQNQMNSNKLWQQYEKFRKRKAAEYAPAFYKALQAQFQYYAETKDFNNLPTQPLQTVLKSVYTEVGRIWAMNTYYSILKDAGVKHSTPLLRVKRNGAFGLNEEFVQAILDFFQTDLFNTVTNITETTRQFIIDEVSKGIEQQLSLDEIINNILKSGITKTRAANIARTETMKAANAAEQIGNDRTGLLTRKEWISVRDKRTRHDHINVDGDLVDDGKPFNVGGYLMQRPGSLKSEDGRRVPAKEVCNCRCVIGRRVMRGEDGLPLRKFG
jgi:hypothetical protein